MELAKKYEASADTLVCLNTFYESLRNAVNASAVKLKNGKSDKRLYDLLNNEELREIFSENFPDIPLVTSADRYYANGLIASCLKRRNTPSNIIII